MAEASATQDCEINEYTGKIPIDETNEADIAHASSEAFDCEICELEKRKSGVNAEGYCIDCKAHLCMRCVRDHCRGSIAHHIVMDPEGRAFMFKERANSKSEGLQDQERTSRKSDISSNMNNQKKDRSTFQNKAKCSVERKMAHNYNQRERGISDNDIKQQWEYAVPVKSKRPENIHAVQNLRKVRNVDGNGNNYAEDECTIS